VDVMAGTGYWARVLAEAGGDVTASDLCEPGVDNDWHGADRRYFDVQYGLDAAYVAGKHAAHHPDSALLLCWPPMSDAAARAAHAHRIAGGRTIVYVGEGHGGCTGDDTLWRILFDESDAECIGGAAWLGLHDNAWICTYPGRHE